MKGRSCGDARRARVALVGVGNIGSSLLDHVARMDLESLTLIDNGAYESKNLQGQSIDRRAIGRAKVKVAAERIASIAPRLTVMAIKARVEDVPRGLLRAQAMLSCLRQQNLAGICEPGGTVAGGSLDRRGC